MIGSVFTTGPASNELDLPVAGLSLANITILVPDYDKAIAFFRETLDFTVTADETHDNKRWVVVTPPGGGCGLVLAQPKNDTERAVTGNQTGGRVSFFLETNSFAKDHARIKNAGVAFLEEPRQETYGTVAVFQDPFGNKWDLIERKE